MQTHEYEWYKEHTFLYPNLGYFDLIDKSYDFDSRY